MGLCCQRPARDKENINNKYRWPNGSTPARLNSDSTESRSPRGSVGDPLDEGDESAVFHETELPMYSRPSKDSGCHPSSNTHLQVNSSYGSRKGSRTSSSGRSSLASVVSVQSAVQLGRMSSLKQDFDCPAAADDRRRNRPRRAVSLRLPSRYRRPSDNETKLPTIYVDDPPIRSVRRKSSLQRALSLLTLTSSSSAETKPVQRILRQPTRRHHVRGISGLPIACENTSGLSRTQTVYYPTHVPMRSRRPSAVYS